MSFDLQMMRDAPHSSVAMPREHAIYREAQGANQKVQRARNIADLLERGYRARTGTTPTRLLNISA